MVSCRRRPSRNLNIDHMQNASIGHLPGRHLWRFGGCTASCVTTVTAKRNGGSIHNDLSRALSLVPCFHPIMRCYSPAIHVGLRDSLGQCCPCHASCVQHTVQASSCKIRPDGTIDRSTFIMSSRLRSSCDACHTAKVKCIKEDEVPAGGAGIWIEHVNSAILLRVIFRNINRDCSMVAEEWGSLWIHPYLKIPNL